MALRADIVYELVRIVGGRATVRVTIQEGRDVLEDLGEFTLGPGGTISTGVRFKPKMKLPAYLMEE